jgi:hypothetical protein
MIKTTFKFNGHYITVEAIHYKGYPATLEEPGEGDNFEIANIIINKQEFESIEELAEFLNMDATETDIIIETNLKNEMYENGDHFRDRY